MSRCSLDNYARGTEVCIGWDPALKTFFCTVIDFELGGGPDSMPCIWYGAAPDEIFPNPEPLIDIITPYACKFDRGQLITMLYEDKVTDSERIYGFEDKYEDEDEDDELELVDELPRSFIDRFLTILKTRVF